MLVVMDKQPGYGNQLMAELRNIEVQKDRLRFRHNLEKLGEFMAFEISKDFEFETKTIQTPLESTTAHFMKYPLVISTVFRAGLPFYQGFLNIFSHAESAFVGSYRKEEPSDEVEVEMEYVVSPKLEDKNLLIADPMLASGKSLSVALRALLENGTPKNIYIAAVISAPEGIDYLNKTFENKVKIWTFSLDRCLNEHHYIIPGLGDAGDLAFGSKV
jgi:uracil phosphoribosyltransferase